MSNLRSLIATGSVTDEVLSLTESITDGWYRDGPIDWQDVWDRLDGTWLNDGTCLDIPELDSPAQRKIRKHISSARKQG